MCPFAAGPQSPGAVPCHVCRRQAWSLGWPLTHSLCLPASHFPHDHFRVFSKAFPSVVPSTLSVSHAAPVLGFSSVSQLSACAFLLCFGNQLLFLTGVCSVYQDGPGAQRLLAHGGGSETRQWVCLSWTRPSKGKCCDLEHLGPSPGTTAHHCASHREATGEQPHLPRDVDVGSSQQQGDEKDWDEDGQCHVPTFQ